MRTVHVTKGIEAQPEQVFDLITDHAGYAQFRGITSSELLKEGEPAPNGVGAMRRVVSRPFRFEEEITAFERPTRMDYLIKKINAPVEHQGASIRLLEDRGRTIVEWTSTLRVTTPLASGIQERIWELALARGFRRVLEDVERIARGR